MGVKSGLSLKGRTRRVFQKQGPEANILPKKDVRGWRKFHNKQLKMRSLYQLL
jgi:hypothetical protein